MLMYLYTYLYTNANTYSFCIGADIFSLIRVWICIGIQWGFELKFQLVDCICVCIILVILIIIVVVVIDLVVVVVVVVALQGKKKLFRVVFRSS